MAIKSYKDFKLSEPVDDPNNPENWQPVIAPTSEWEKHQQRKREDIKNWAWETGEKTVPWLALGYFMIYLGVGLAWGLPLLLILALFVWALIAACF